MQSVPNPFEQIEQRLAFLESQLANLPKPTPTTPKPDVLDMETLLQYIPNVSKATVYRWLHMRTIPSYKVGRRVYFRRADIDVWLANKKRHTTAENVERIRTKS